MPKTAFVFPGQGSQQIGMGKDLYDFSDKAKELYNRADEITGLPLSKISFEGPGDLLKQTHITQPALFVHSYILFTLLNEKIFAECAAGHSLGEYTALAYSQALDFETGVQLVHKRGQLMKDAGDVNRGTMAAIIGLTEAQVAEICIKAQENQTVVAANFNSPGQIVISGDIDAVHRAMKIAKEAPYNCRLAKELEVSGAFHSELMKMAADELWLAIENIHINNALIPIYTNVEAEPETDGRVLEQLLYRQLISSVKWELSVRNMIRDGVDTFYEIGSGKVLRGLIKKINSDVALHNISSKEDLEKYLS